MSIRAIKHLLPTLGVLLLMVTPSVAQRYDAYPLVDSVTVGERFRIALTVEHDGHAIPLFPLDFLPDSLREAPFLDLGELLIIRQIDAGRRTISLNRVVDSVLYEATTFELDSAFVEEMPLGLVSAGDTLIAGTPPVQVNVISLVPEDAEGIRDITTLADFPGSSWLWFLFPLLVVLGFAYWYWRRRRRGKEERDEDYEPEPEIQPYAEALERLRQLETMDLHDPEKVKPFYVELSELLRNYLKRRADVPALETTTRELLERLQQSIESGIMTRELIGEIRAILSHADLVKFADMHPASDAGLSAIGMTRQAIDETESEYEARQEIAETEPQSPTKTENEAWRETGGTETPSPAITEHEARRETGRTETPSPAKTEYEARRETGDAKVGNETIRAGQGSGEDGVDQELMKNDGRE